MTQQLRAYTALAANLSLVPRTHSASSQLTPASGGLNISSLQGHLNLCAYTQTYIFIIKNNKNWTYYQGPCRYIMYYGPKWLTLLFLNASSNRITNPKADCQVQLPSLSLNVSLPLVLTRSQLNSQERSSSYQNWPGVPKPCQLSN